MEISQRNIDKALKNRRKTMAQKNEILDAIQHVASEQLTLYLTLEDVYIIYDDYCSKKLNADFKLDHTSIESVATLIKIFINSYAKMTVPHK